MHHRRTMAVLLAAAFALAGCTGAASPVPGSPAPTGSPQGPAVTIIDFAFRPASLTIRVGQTVTWTNTGQAPHSVRWLDGMPESPQLTHGARYRHTFDAAGTYRYVCGVHGPSMSGAIVVTP